jgi:hypothetical protein
MLQAVQQLWTHEHKALRAGDGKRKCSFPALSYKGYHSLYYDNNTHLTKQAHTKLPAPLLYRRTSKHVPKSLAFQCIRSPQQQGGEDVAIKKAVPLSVQAGRCKARQQTCMHTTKCVPLCVHQSTKYIRCAAVTHRQSSVLNCLTTTTACRCMPVTTPHNHTSQ